MGVRSEDLEDEVPEGTTCTERKGMLVVTVVRRAPGPVVTEVVGILEERVTRADFRSPLRAVVDVRDAAFSPSGPELRLGATRLGSLGKQGRIALVVADDLQFGLGRMFGVLAEETGFDVRPFRDPSAARRWLGDP